MLLAKGNDPAEASSRKEGSLYLLWFHRPLFKNSRLVSMVFYLSYLLAQHSHVNSGWSLLIFVSTEVSVGWMGPKNATPYHISSTISFLTLQYSKANEPCMPPFPSIVPGFPVNTEVASSSRWSCKSPRSWTTCSSGMRHKWEFPWD